MSSHGGRLPFGSGRVLHVVCCCATKMNLRSLSPAGTLSIIAIWPASVRPSGLFATTELPSSLLKTRPKTAASGTTLPVGLDAAADTSTHFCLMPLDAPAPSEPPARPCASSGGHVTSA